MEQQLNVNHTARLQWKSRHKNFKNYLEYICSVYLACFILNSSKFLQYSVLKFLVFVCFAVPIFVEGVALDLLDAFEVMFISSKLWRQLVFYLSSCVFIVNVLFALLHTGFHNCKTRPLILVWFPILKYLESWFNWHQVALGIFFSILNIFNSNYN